MISGGAKASVSSVNNTCSRWVLQHKQMLSVLIVVSEENTALQHICFCQKALNRRMQRQTAAPIDTLGMNHPLYILYIWLVTLSIKPPPPHPENCGALRSLLWSSTLLWKFAKIEKSFVSFFKKMYLYICFFSENVFWMMNEKSQLCC